MRIRYSEAELFAILEAEMLALRPRRSDSGLGRRMAGREVQLPCHPRERVTVAEGGRDAACPDCGQSFPLERATTTA